jgi:hypothetical protein
VTHEQHRLTYEDGYREGLAARRSRLATRAEQTVRFSHQVPTDYHEVRIAHLLEAIVWALLAQREDQP